MNVSIMAIDLDLLTVFFLYLVPFSQLIYSSNVEASERIIGDLKQALENF